MKSDRRLPGRDRRWRLFRDDGCGPARPQRHRRRPDRGGGRAGQGIAYSTREPAHVLNVRAEVMSAWADDLEHFVRGRRERRRRAPATSSSAGSSGAISRAILERGASPAAGAVVEREAVEAEPSDGGWRVALDDGEDRGERRWCWRTATSRPSRCRSGAAAREFINNPWGAEALAAVEDLAATQRRRAAGRHRPDDGRRGAVARRGRASRADRCAVAARADSARRMPTSCRRRSRRTTCRTAMSAALWRWLRRRGAEVGWRAAVDALRPHSQALWQGLPPERAAALPAPCAAVVGRPPPPHRAGGGAALARSDRRGPARDRRRPDPVGRGAGRRADGRHTAGAAAADDRRRPLRLHAQLHRPAGAISRTSDPMLDSMLDDGLVKPDELGIGLEVDEQSRVAGSERAWAMGPLTKGRYWEIIAVPDIRGQAAEVADDIADGAWVDERVRAWRAGRRRSRPVVARVRSPRARSARRSGR